MRTVQAFPRRTAIDESRASRTTFEVGMQGQPHMICTAARTLDGPAELRLWISFQIGNPGELAARMTEPAIRAHLSQPISRRGDRQGASGVTFEE